MADCSQLSVVIPTYRRERVLIETIEYLIDQRPPPDEILIVDQTPHHEPYTTQMLAGFASQGRIRWLRSSEPSIPQAMNRGLLEARNDVVLFVDDDVRPEANLISAHLATHRRQPNAVVAGRVIQPWQEAVDFKHDPDNLFAGIRARLVDEFIGCNFSVRRSAALDVGGFDENFVKVAYRFEAEFSHRFSRAGNPILFEPEACLHHLKSYEGGTRAHGQLLTTTTPNHAVGKYYFALRTMPWFLSVREMLWQPIRSVVTRHHLRRPWWIPLSFVAELRGLAWALRLHLRGPALVATTKGAETRA